MGKYIEKRWVEKAPEDQEAIALLMNELGIDGVLASLLVNRGISAFDDARKFFRPSLADLHDPFLMHGMDEAVFRIGEAMDAGEKIMIYGDYDVDGTTAVALVYSFFKKLYTKIDYYVPHRYTEGYGISFQGIDHAAANGITLIVALDCGIKSVDKVSYAAAKGIDFIICDHHLPGDELPAAAAILDPKQAACTYPYTELSGCGIGFKLIQAYAIAHGIAEASVHCYLDLVAVSIASDIVPITGENRILAWHGLQRLNTEPCKGLQALIEISGRKNNLTITDVVFLLGPRINAAGRIDDAKHAVNLLISDDHALATEKSQLINLKNTERKEHDTTITLEALAMLDQTAAAGQKTTVVYNKDWHKGVIGIVASRLTETYYRPTVVLTNANGHVAGSARSVPGFDLYEALSQCAGLLEQFGGHRYAAGLTMKAENIAAFQQRFEEVVEATIPPELLVQQFSIEAVISLGQISPKFFRILGQFAPFGPQNMSPVFLSRNVYAYASPTLAGNKHLKLCVYQQGSPVFDCIGFGLGEYALQIKKDTPFDICYTIEENIWQEKRSVQLNIKDIRLAEQQNGRT